MDVRKEQARLATLVTENAGCALRGQGIVLGELRLALGLRCLLTARSQRLSPRLWEGMREGERRCLGELRLVHQRG